MRRSIWIPTALLSSTLLVIAGPGFASSPADSHGEAEDDVGVTIEPGMWQVTTESKLPMIDQTKSETKMECLTENHFTPERMTGNHKSCKIDKVSTQDDEMSWSLACKTPTGQFNGTGSFKSTGDKARGEMTTTMKLGEQSLVSKVRWEGERLGGCDMELPQKKEMKQGKQGKDEAKEKGTSGGAASDSSDGT
jgi:hypothetical protein